MMFLQGFFFLQSERFKRYLHSLHRTRRGLNNKMFLHLNSPCLYIVSWFLLECLSKNNTGTLFGSLKLIIWKCRPLFIWSQQFLNTLNSFVMSNYSQVSKMNYHQVLNLQSELEYDALRPLGH